MSRLAVRIEPVRGTSGVRGRSVLFASDLHLGWRWSRRVAHELVLAARATRPTAIALGGDLVDRRHALPQLARLVRLLARVAPTCAVAGNHDRALGVDLVRGACEASGATWLEHAPLRIGELTLANARNLPVARPTETVVAIAHDPDEIPSGCHFRVALAGHLHGGQAIAFTYRGRHYPGVLAYRWCGDRFETASGPVVVSKGCADTLPVRFRCAREVVLLDFE